MSFIGHTLSRSNFAEVAPPMQSSPFEHLENTALNASDLALRVATLADRLLGCTPCSTADACASKGIAPAVALLDRMRIANGQIDEVLARIHTDLTRIENAIS